jgi:hypothetical protein
LVVALGVERDLGLWERMVLRAGSSCALAVVTAIGIGLASNQLTGSVFASALAAITLAFLAIAALRTRPNPAVDDSKPDEQLPAPAAPVSRRRAASALALWSTAGALVLASFLIASQPNPTDSDVQQLWMTRHGSDGVDVGVYNGATESATYRLTIGPSTGAAGQSDVAIDVSLAAGQRWEQVVPLQSIWPAGSGIVATLYINGQTSPMRMVALAASPSPSAAGSRSASTTASP